VIFTLLYPDCLPEQEDKDRDPTTYTRQMSTGDRLCFRGSLINRGAIYGYETLVADRISRLTEDFARVIEDHR